MNSVGCKPEVLEQEFCGTSRSEDAWHAQDAHRGGMMDSKNLSDGSAQTASSQSFLCGNDSPRRAGRVKDCVDIYRAHAAHVQYAGMNALSREGVCRIESAGNHDSVCHERDIVSL